VVILAGDVGGTKTHLALFEPGPPLRLVRLETFQTGAFASLEEMVGAFLREGDVPLAAAALGVAGPVVGGAAALPNVTWGVEANQIAKRLGLAAVTLLNDLEASVWALEALGSADVATVLAGAPDAARRCCSARTDARSRSRPRRATRTSRRGAISRSSSFDGSAHASAG